MNRRILGAAATGAVILAIAVANVASAHIVKKFGPYTIALGWLTEPTYVGEHNAVVVLVTDRSDKPVNDLAAGDLTVTVAAGGQTSAGLPLNPSYDPDTGFGTPGLYTADVIPTMPGDYTFHLSGKVHGTTVDETATSSETTFNTVEDPASVQFPAKVPTTTEISAKTDKLDARVQSATDAAAAASAAATDASNAASRALLVGAAVGAVGMVLGLTGVMLALRARRRA